MSCAAFNVTCVVVKLSFSFNFALLITTLQILILLVSLDMSIIRFLDCCGGRLVSTALIHLFSGQITLVSLFHLAGGAWLLLSFS